MYTENTIAAQKLDRGRDVTSSVLLTIRTIALRQGACLGQFLLLWKKKILIC